jgi:hypothetical protein
MLIFILDPTRHVAEKPSTHHVRGEGPSRNVLIHLIKTDTAKPKT